MDTRDIEDMNTLSECRVKNVRSSIQIRIKKLGGSVSAHATLILKDPNVAKHLSRFHDKYVVVPADNAPNNILFVCKSYYIDCLIKEVRIDNSPGNHTYTPTTYAKEEILDKHQFVFVPLKCQPEMKNWIYHHSTGYLNYTSVLTNIILFLGLSKGPQNIFPNY